MKEKTEITFLAVDEMGAMYDASVKELFANREISAQLGVLTEETNYAALQKAYSIWICNKHIPKKLQNTVTRYTLKREDCIGTCDEPEANHDLLEIIMIRRGNDAGKESIFDYLTGIFTVNFEKMKPYLGERESTQKIERKVKGMTGLGADIYQKGRREGREEKDREYREKDREYRKKDREYQEKLAAMEAEIARLKALLN